MERPCALHVMDEQHMNSGTTPATGQSDTCKVCGKALIYDGRFWQHKDGALRHEPVPAKWCGDFDPLDPPTKGAAG